MNISETLQELLKGRVDFVLVGGVAVTLHGVVRGTMDLDIVLAMNDANLDRFIEVAKSLKMTPRIPVSMEVLKDKQAIDRFHKEKHMLAFSLWPADPAGAVIDVLVRPEASYEELSKDAVLKYFLGLEIKVASIKHLLLMKTAAGRGVDLFDIKALEALQAAKGEQ
ncbi:MAG: hypothetical protein QM533_06200 [Cytophagales bacterium]|nr:hypothetical protein [Cytophagales bacterium]